MKKRTSIKNLIIELAAQHKFESITHDEIAALQDELQQRTGRSVKADYIFQTLSETGQYIPLDDKLTSVTQLEEYAKRLAKVLKFKDFTSFKRSLSQIDTFYRQYASENDRIGIAYTKWLAYIGERRARQIAHNPRVRPAKKREKSLIAGFFHAWRRDPERIGHILHMLDIFISLS